MQIAMHANSEAELKGTFDMMQFKLDSIRVLAKMRNERCVYDLPDLRYTAASGETLRSLLETLDADTYFSFNEGSEKKFHEANPFSLEEDLAGKTVVLPFWMVCRKVAAVPEDIRMELKEFESKRMAMFPITTLNLPKGSLQSMTTLPNGIVVIDECDKVEIETPQDILRRKLLSMGLDSDTIGRVLSLGLNDIMIILSIKDLNLDKIKRLLSRDHITLVDNGDIVLP